MTKRFRAYLLLFFLIALFLGGLWIAWKAKSPSTLQANRESRGRINRTLSSHGETNSQSQKNKDKISNQVSKKAEKKWKKNLEDQIWAQGGESVKSFSAESVGRFNYSYEGISIEVESLIITLQDHQDQKTTFRLLVDASTGKILRNWDNPIFDPAIPREEFKVKVDSRYHQ